MLPPEQPPTPPRLEGWDDIAYYLRVTRRQAQRWEKELGLPIHREERSKRASVFAFTQEIDAWRQERHTPPEIVKDVTKPAGLEPRMTVFAVAGIVILAIAAGVVLSGYVHGPTRAEPPVQMGRLLVRSTSEGRTPTRFPVPDLPYFLKISSDGTKLFVAGLQSRTLSVVNTTQLSLHALNLPIDIGALAVSPKGMLYVGSTVDGVVAVDIAREQLLPGTIATGGLVRTWPSRRMGRSFFWPWLTSD